MKRYDVGIIACSRTKRPGADRALTLYRGGPFQLSFRHASKFCRRVLIMSAKYGLIEPDARGSLYDVTIFGLKPIERAALLDLLADQMLPLSDLDVLSYLPKVYWETCHEALPPVAEQWDRPYRRLPMKPAWARLSAELNDPAL